jgi:hypothetical protein
MHIVAGLCAIAVPLLLFLKPISDLDGNGWEAYQRTDVLVLIFCVLALVLVGASLVSQRRALLIAASGLLFASFGLLIPGPFEAAAQNEDVGIGVGAYLSIIAALVGAAAAAIAAEMVPSDAEAAPVGAGLSPSRPLAGVVGAPAPRGEPKTPAGPGGTAPGWYDDPHRQARLRYFDGRDWTEQTSN